MNTKPFTHSVLFTLFFLCFTVACKNDDGDPLPTVDVTIKQTSLGNVMTDGYGKTLYFFSNDAGMESKCSGGCLDNWPVFSVANPRLDTGLDPADFKSITRADGTKQVTFKGWPLYYFKNDLAVGDVKGDKVNNLWFVAKPNYSIMIANSQLVGDDGKSYMSNYQEGVGMTQYFVDAKGLTLYAYTNDKKNKNNFTKQDFSNNPVWPIYTAEISEIPSILDKSLFTVITVFDKKQLAYKGWPLYYFGKDANVRGANKGVSFPRVGVWPVVQKESAAAPE